MYSSFWEIAMIVIVVAGIVAACSTSARFTTAQRLAALALSAFAPFVGGLTVVAFAVYRRRHYHVAKPI